MTDPIADLLTRIRNAQTSRHAEVRIPYSKLKHEIVKLLYQEGFVGAYRTLSEAGKKLIEVSLRYVGKKEPTIIQLKRVSRPGRRVYSGSEEIPVVRNGMGVVILSTSKGILTGRQAKAEKVGGEVLCSIW